VYLGLVVAFVLLSAAIFCWTEQSADRPADADALSYVDAIYFTWITITTLGYSDSFITTKASMVWCIFFIFTGAGFFAAVASHVASLRQERAIVLRHSKAYIQKLDADFITALEHTVGDKAVHAIISQRASSREDAPPRRLGREPSQQPNQQPNQQPSQQPSPAGAGEHDRLSFLVTMLVHLDLASRADILRILDYFETMDIDGNGSVSMDELRAEGKRIEAQTSDMEPSLSERARHAAQQARERFSVRDSTRDEAGGGGAAAARGGTVKPHAEEEDASKFLYRGM